MAPNQTAIQRDNPEEIMIEALLRQSVSGFLASFCRLFWKSLSAFELSFRKFQVYCYHEYMYRMSIKVAFKFLFFS